VKLLAWHPDAPGSLLDPEEDQSWRDAALCAEVGGDFWFPETGTSAAAVKRICAACPVRVSCLEYALENCEQWGIWGGLTERELREARLRHTGLPAAEILAEADERLSRYRKRGLAA
jgi:WhiB family redox-sensing transcriptional regulator